MNFTQAMAILVYFCLVANPLAACMDRISPKTVGTDKRVTQGAGETLRTDEGSEKALGSREIQRPDGGKDKIYYSVTTQEEEAEQQREEKEKVEKSWDILRNIIIDKRTK
jgi:hypothetical protein